MLQGDDNAMTVAGAQVDALARVGPLQQVKTQHATAISVQLPRALPAVEQRFLQEAAQAGDSFFYGWGNGKDRIEGASVDLAMALVRTWGNCAVEMLPVQDTYDAWVFSAAFVDLETGFTLTRQFRQSKKWVVHGKHDEARKEDIRFQIGQSKAIRNVVLNALPKWLASKGVEAAKKNVRGRIEKLIDTKGGDYIRSEAVRLLGEVGVSEASILEKFGRAKVAALSVEDLVIMHGDLQALKNGQDTAENVYPPRQTRSARSAKSDSDQLADQLEGIREPADEPAHELDISFRPDEKAADWSTRVLKVIGTCTSMPELEAINSQLTELVESGAVTQKRHAELVEAINRQAATLPIEA